MTRCNNMITDIGSTSGVNFTASTVHVLSARRTDYMIIGSYNVKETATLMTLICGIDDRKCFVKLDIEPWTFYAVGSCMTNKSNSSSCTIDSLLQGPRECIFIILLSPH